MRVYTQLTQEQRYQIYALMKAEHNQAEIAAIVGVDKSTISREVRRNRGLRGYRPQQAHQFALNRRQTKVRKRITQAHWRLVERLLREDWSPEQISLWLAAEGHLAISHERVYQHILEDKAQGGDLYRHLRCQKQRKKRYGSYDRRGQLCNRVSMTERKSRLALLAKVPNKGAEAVKQAVLELLKPLADRVHTVTSDNGKEFARHEAIADALGADFYFAHPYASWERGLNENTNGLVRQYFPKECDFTTLTESDIQRAMNKLNNRPRKCLGMKTPNQVFFGINPPVALAS